MAAPSLDGPAVLMALDLGSQTGWAACTSAFAQRPYHPAGSITWGWWQLSSPGDWQGKTLLRLLSRLRAKALELKAKEIIIEHWLPNPKRPDMLAPRLNGIACLVAADLNIGFNDDAWPSQVKKHWTGSGKAEKPEIKERCLSMGLEVETWDEADAIAILDYRLSKILKDRIFPIGLPPAA